MTPRYRIQISRRASIDLQRIFDGIAATSPRNATNVARRILAAADGLKEVPHRTIVAGQRDTEAYPVRSLPVQSWVLFFEVHDDSHAVHILRIRHGAQRPLKRYR
jgi:plasmid stabilization system protein ParE